MGGRANRTRSSRWPGSEIRLSALFPPATNGVRSGAFAALRATRDPAAWRVRFERLPVAQPGAMTTWAPLWQGYYVPGSYRVTGAERARPEVEIRATDGFGLLSQIAFDLDGIDGSLGRRRRRARRSTARRVRTV